ncbi:MAG TPA: FAD-dependent oxidoreductase [Burkholderiales bacterium]
MRSRLLGAREVAAGTMAFSFARPPGFEFQAGQNVLVTLVDPPENDAQGPSRTFTLASAPHEPELMIATRMRDSAFKRVLAGAAPGLPVEIEGPNGVMVLHEDAARPAVFLAGGIGITPFLSMARDAAQRRLPHRLFLFYGNRRPEDAAFLDELAALEKANPRYRLIAAMSEPEKSARPWRGETGFIDRAMLERHLGAALGGAASPVYYFAGPPAMAMAMQRTLGAAGVREDDMRSEEFYGY